MSLLGGLLNLPATGLYMSFTYKPKNRKRNKTHGFLARKQTTSGRKILLRRLRKGRHSLAV